MGEINFVTHNKGETRCTSVGRGGDVRTIGIAVSARTRPGSGERIVDLAGITSQDKPMTTDIQITPEAMDEMCATWIKSRGADFSANISTMRQYGDKTLQMSIYRGENGMDLAEVVDGTTTVIAAVDTFWLHNTRTGHAKDGALQICLYDPLPSGGDGPVACAVFTPDGLAIHVGDSGDLGEVSEFDHRQGIVTREF